MEYMVETNKLLIKTRNTKMTTAFGLECPIQVCQLKHLDYQTNRQTKELLRLH